MIQRDDEEVVEDVYLEDMAEQAHFALAEGARMGGSAAAVLARFGRR